MAEEEQAAAQDENREILRAEKIYLKDLSLETPNSPGIFTVQWQPEMSFDIAQKVSRVSEDDLYEVVLVLTATIKVGEQTAYLAEVHQAGLFTIKVNDREKLDRLLAVFCPRMLYPYAGAAISDLVSKAGFPQLLLAPVNFDNLYQQRLDELKNNGTTPAAGSS